jgi:glycosyltransferase involved in cell wall biosynthesis
MAPHAAITFAIPYFRNLSYLREAIASVLGQTIDNWEVVVVDDAGPEPAGDLIASFDDDRIRYVRNTSNLGLAGNWNECLSHVNAPLVTLLHSDDRLLPTYGEAVIHAAHEHPDAAAVFTDATIIGPDGEPARSLPDLAKRLIRRPHGDHDVLGDAGLAGITRGNYIFCPTLCYRTSSLGVAPFDGSWNFMLDLDHMSTLLLAGARLRAVRQPLYEYRRHDSNQTKTLTDDSQRFEEEIRFAQQLAVRADGLSWSKTSRAARLRVLVRAHLAMQMLSDLLRGRSAAAKRKASLLMNDLRHPGRLHQAHL